MRVISILLLSLLTVLKKFMAYRRTAAYVLLLASLLAGTHFNAHAQNFVHPGGLHTQVDLDRMKTQVAAGAHPWIDDWNVLITDPLAQNNYTAAANANMGVSRQRADQDAHAAYLNALRWYISGDTSYAACAVRICNAWSAAVNQVPTGTDIPGLSGIPIFDFALAGEVLRLYTGWSPSSFTAYKNMMTTYLYPVCHDFLTNHNGACISAYWANWDICNIGALMAMGVLCDDSTKYNEGVNYFKSGLGNGSIMNAVYTLQPGNLGQWQESGRDQEHAQLGIGLLGYACQVAWNQGLDLFGYSNNRLLAGAEYVAQTNLWHNMPYTTYNNCDGANQYWVAANGRGRLDDRPLWELMYNHYVVQQGLTAAGVKSMAQLMRPEHGSSDHLGYGTLTFTLNATASPYPPLPAPTTPSGLTATAGISQVTLNWTAPAGDVAQGYTVSRSTSSGGPYTTIASWSANTTTQYIDRNIVNGSKYYYVVSATNQSGTGNNSAEAGATPVAAGALPAGWSSQDIGTVAIAGSASYASASNNSFLISGSGNGIGGTADGFSYVYSSVTGDATITARLSSVSGTLSRTGIMIMENLASDSRALIIKLGDAGGRMCGFGTRSTAGANMTWQQGNQYTWIPVWFRLQRAGDLFTAFESSDGVNWFNIGSSTLPINSTYYVGLAASSGNGTGTDNSTFDNVIVAGGGNSIPAAPANLTAVGMTSSRIDLSWPSSASALGYNIKRSSTSGGPYTVIANGITDTSYSDNGLSPQTTYYYVVSAINTGGESAASTEARAATMIPIPPSPPKGLLAVAGNGRISLSWNVSSQAASYNVKRATVSGGPYTTIASRAATNYTDSALTNGTNYYYVVTAVNSAGESINSIQVSGSPSATNGTYSYWPFNETGGTTATDVWGGRNASLSTGATWNAGIINGGLRMDGSANGYATLPTGPVSTLSDFTVAAWVKLDVATNWARLFDFGSGTGSYMFLTPVNGATGTVRYAITTGGGSAEQQINCTTALSTGVWYHLAVTLTGGVGILYINGAEVGRNSAMTLNPSSLGSTTQNWIGRSQYNDPKLAGTVDEFRIYNRALSASEVATLNNTLPPVAQDQTITFPALPQKQVGNPDFAPGATASSGLALRYTSSDTTIATIVNGNIHIKAAGTTAIVASQPGDSVYNAAPPVSSQLTVTGLSVPAVPRGLFAAGGNGRILLSWSSSSSATGYKVKRATVNSGPYTNIASVAAPNYTDSSVTNGTTYYYVVSATNAVGESANSVQVSTTPDASAYSYWPFDETSGSTAGDVWGGRNGTLATGATWSSGKLNGAVHLDGTVNGYVALPSGLVSTLNDFTIATWVKLDTVVNWARVFDFGTGTTVNMFLTAKNGATGTVRYAVTTAGGRNEQQINCSTALSTGTWYHLTVTLSGNLGILYVNGVEVGRNSAITLHPSSLGSTTQNWFGRSQYTADPTLAGSLDDFRMYSRALGASEVASLAGTLPTLIRNNTINSVVDENARQRHEALSIYPNPTSGNLKIRLNNKETGRIMIKIYNSNGHIVQQVMDRKENKIYEREFNLKHWAKSVYYVQIIIGSSDSIKKIIIQ